MGRDLAKERYEEAMALKARRGQVPAAQMNALGSPTGRVTRDASETSVGAARRVRAGAQRALILAILKGAGERGATAIEVGQQMDPPLISSRTLPRMGEMWEEGLMYVVRERGRCVLGECHPHDKPRQIHTPVSRCDRHGSPVKRGGASVWRAE